MSDDQKFLNLLAKEINQGSHKFSFENLETHLHEAVNALPDGDLKKVLQKQRKENADYLWGLVKPAKKLYVEFEFNIFNKNGLETTLNKISQHHSYKEQIKYLSEVALSYPCTKVFELLLTAQKNENPYKKQLEVLSNVVELCGHLTVNCQNLQVINDLMQVFLREVDTINNEFKASNKESESWLDLKDLIHNFLVYCHLKPKIEHEGISDENIESKKLTEYKDILAAILAIYIDVIIAASQINEDMINHISNIVYLLLGDSSSHILDTANQIFSLDSGTIKTVLPFLRKVLKTTKTSTKEYSNYIKYVCLTWKIQRCVCNEEMVFIRKIVCSLTPPKNFLSWLTTIDSSLVQDFGLSGLDGLEITKKLLECKEEENIEKILDLAGCPEKWNRITESVNENNSEEEEDNESSDVLFFVDAQGSSELLNQCEEKELTNRRSEKILKTQISALLEKRVESDEETNFDINLDESDKEETFEFGLLDTESKNGDEDAHDWSIYDNDVRVSEEGNVANIVTSPVQNENLTQSDKKRKKRKSQMSSTFSEGKKRKNSLKSLKKWT